MKTIRQLALNSPGAVREILVEEGRRIPAEWDFPVRVLTGRQLGAIISSKTPQGVVAVVAVPSGSSSERIPPEPGGKILLCEDIQDPGNVGNLIRCAAAFGVDGVLMSEKCADPFSPKCVQAAAGATLSVWIRRSAAYLQMVRALKKKGFSLVAADLDGKEIAAVGAGRKTIVALGSEGTGFSEELLREADRIVRIPVDTRRIESLNVAACGAICMYLLRGEE